MAVEYSSNDTERPITAWPKTVNQCYFSYDFSVTVIVFFYFSVKLQLFFSVTITVTVLDFFQFQLQLFWIKLEST